MKLFHLRQIWRSKTELYLSRWALRPFGASGKSGWRVYLHRFHLPDDDGHHNHPSPSFSIVLSGAYTEERFDVVGGEPIKLETRRVSRFNWLPLRRYHRITVLHEPVWTLFFVGPVRQAWGFWIPGRGHVPFAQRLKERGLE